MGLMRILFDFYWAFYAISDVGREFCVDLLEGWRKSQNYIHNEGSKAYAISSRNPRIFKKETFFCPFFKNSVAYRRFGKPLHQSVYVRARRT